MSIPKESGVVLFGKAVNPALYGGLQYKYGCPSDYGAPINSTRLSYHSVDSIRFN